MWLPRSGRIAVSMLMAGAIICLAAGAARVWGCPFCAALSSALREEFTLADHAAVGICQQPATAEDEYPIHTFRIERSLIGEGTGAGQILKAYSTRTYQAGDRVLLMGVGQRPDVNWGPSEALGDMALAYIDRVVAMYLHDKQHNLLSLSTDSLHAPASTEVQSGLPPGLQSVNQRDRTAREVAWLQLAWENLESEETWVGRDCFNLVAGASLADLRVWVQQLEADEVLRRLEDKGGSIEHRRFYWTVLSLCGRAADAEFANRRIFGDTGDGQLLALDSSELDAAISCLLLLGGEPALQDIENRLLANPQRRYAERYAAIVALRVHAVEFREIAPARICKALSHTLNEPAIADLVIPDLARLEDWSHVPRLMELFRQAESEHRYLRMPIVNYLRACPLADAKTALSECQQIDPDAYRRASVIFPSVPTARDD